MKIKIRASFYALAATACGQTTDSGSDQLAHSSEAKTESVGQLLRDGQQQACAHPAVQQLILERAGPKSVTQGRTLNDFTLPDLALAKATLPPQVLSDFHLIAINRQTGEMRCQVNIATPFQTQERPYQFVLQASQDAPNEFIMSGDFRIAMKLAEIDLQTMATDLARSRFSQPSKTALENSTIDPPTQNALVDAQSAVDNALRTADAAREALANDDDAESWEHRSIENNL